jgi:hypothetical protein
MDGMLLAAIVGWRCFLLPLLAPDTLRRCAGAALGLRFTEVIHISKAQKSPLLRAA